MLVAAAALLLIVQPFSGDDASSDRPSRASSDRLPRTPYEKRAEEIEKQLSENPKNERLLHTTTTAWIAAGNNKIRRTRFEGQLRPAGIRRDFKAGLRAWNRYLQRTGGEADANLAEQAGDSFFKLMEIGSRNLTEIEANAAGAARALRIAGRHLPTLFTLSNVAINEYFNGEFAAGDKAARGAAADVSKAQAKGVIVELREYRELAELFRGQLKQSMEQLRATGAKQLSEPLKAYASSTGLNTEEVSARELRAFRSK